MAATGFHTADELNALLPGTLPGLLGLVIDTHDPGRLTAHLDVPLEERLTGTLAATAVSAWLGARVFRAHDVAATRQTLDMVASIQGTRPPARTTRGLA